MIKNLNLKSNRLYKKERKERGSKLIIQVAVMVFIRETSKGLEFWMQRRNEAGHPLDNLWEFPGGKMRDRETALEASRREVWEEVGIILDKATRFRFYHWDYGAKSYCLHVCLGCFEQLPISESQQWFSVEYKQKSQTLSKKIPPLNHLIVDDVFQYVADGGQF